MPVNAAFILTLADTRADNPCSPVTARPDLNTNKNKLNNIEGESHDKIPGTDFNRKPAGYIAGFYLHAGRQRSA